MTITVFPDGLYDAYGNPISSLSGAINVHDADVHVNTINRQFDSHTATTTTFAVAAAAGATSVTVTSSVGFVVGDHIHIENVAMTTVEYVHPQITVIVGNVITLDRPLDNSYQIGDSFIKVLISMNVNGTLGAPVAFTVYPLPGEIMHLKTITLAMQHTTAGDFGTFGDLAPLTNGVVLRRYNGLTASYNTYTIWKTNADIDLDTGTVKFPTRSGGGGIYGTSAIGIFDQAGSVVYLNGANGDYIEILIQDNLSTLGGFWANMQGHFES